jgi:uncharacterized membrane protein HdeD (DUF308 family)
MSEPATVSQIPKLRDRWKWFLALGSILLVLGIAGVSVATLLEVTSLLVFGPLLLVSSIMQLLTASFAEKRKDSVLHFAAAGLELVLGMFILAHPLHRLISLIAVVAIFLIVAGLVRLARSLTAQSRGRGWAIMTGVIALLLGVSVWIGWPTNKLWFVGLCIAIDFLFHGVTWSALGLMERKPLQEPTS